SMIATIESLLGLPPMSIVDHRARRMWAPFRARPRLRPYRAIRPRVVPFGDPGAAVNPATAAMAAASSRWDFLHADAAPDEPLNEAIWKSIRGRRAPMPAPRHRLLGAGGGD